MNNSQTYFAPNTEASDEPSHDCTPDAAAGLRSSPSDGWTGSFELRSLRDAGKRLAVLVRYYQ